MPNKMIEHWQRSRIYGLARDLGMTTKSNDKSADLHQLLESRAGKDSITKLSSDEANSIINELGHRQRFGSSSHPSKFVFKPMPGGISKAQYRKLIALMCELRKLDQEHRPETLEDRLAGIIRKYLHISASPSDPYRWLRPRHMTQLVGIIEGMIVTEKKRRQGGGVVGEQSEYHTG